MTVQYQGEGVGKELGGIQFLKINNRFDFSNLSNK